MEKYLGVKLIEAESCNKNKFLRSQGKMIGEVSGSEEGYKVVYEDGYTFWSPKDVFEKAYRCTDGLTFGLAIEALKQGRLVARKGWNGKGMFVCKQVPAEIDMTIVPNMQLLPIAAKNKLGKMFEESYATGVGYGIKGVSYQNQMLIVKPDGTADSWAPSSSDVFAEDWHIVE